MTKQAYGEKWYLFSAWNQQIQLGFGTEAEADVYLDLLNGDRTINVYHYTEMDAEDCIALNSGDDTDGFRLDLAIDTAREQAAWRAEEEAKRYVAL